ncbi:hypothetical protein N2152v2_007019 [Parachlorella kessleri]
MRVLSRGVRSWRPVVEFFESSPAASAPWELRAPILALRAFNVETALIGDHAKSEMLVLTRCQWWRDAVNACYKGNPPDQPVARALYEVLQQRPLTRYRLQRMITTREEDLTSKEPPASMRALEEYGEGTVGQLLLLQLEAAGLEGPEAEEAALHLGKAVGIANLLRGTRYHAEKGMVYLPRDQCGLAGVDARDILRNKDSQALREVTRAVAADAKLHLEEARSLAGQLPPTARQLLLPAVGADMYLQALLAKDCNLLDQDLLAGRAYSRLAYQLRLKWHQLRGSY